MNMDSVVFGMDGPVMSGTWFSPRSGDKFTVRDSFFEDNVYKILTTDGRCFTLDTINEGGYIQDMGEVKDGGYVGNNKPIDDMNRQNLLKGMDELGDDPSLKEALGMMGDVKEDALLNRPLKPVEEKVEREEEKKEKVETVDINTSIIEKALGKKELPRIDIKVSFKNYPEKEIQMLKDVMDIEVQDVVRWYINRMNKEDILKRVEEGVVGCFVKGEIGKIEEEKKIGRTPRELELDVYRKVDYKPKPKKGGLKKKDE